MSKTSTIFQQPLDFRDESEALYTLLKGKSDAVLAQRTLFKGWTSDDIIGHLHFWNLAADLSLRGSDDFVALIAEVSAVLKQRNNLREFEIHRLNGLRGRDLVETWRSFYLQMANRFAAADPKLRVKWAGPDMSVRSSITARLMETWAHGQAAYDAMGEIREDQDRLKNIAVLGMNTFGWTFVNRRLQVPEQLPYVRLKAPSGAIWEWNDSESRNRVEGQAAEFCQVVTQTRNVADTCLRVTGDVAEQWMAIAQCFAGPPEDPPLQGARRRVSVCQC